MRDETATAANDGGHEVSTEQRLRELGLELPGLPAPAGTYLPGVLHGGVLHLAGQGPLLPDGTLARGRVGDDVTVEEAYGHARRTGLVLLAAARSVLGTLDRVERVLSVLGMVHAASGFDRHPAVINGCSDLFVEVFGEAGRHARAAVGMASLHLGITVEITAVMAVRG
jgi:enamine deaminase RidA (YjgF/YER057c/UK114 family)